MDYIINSQSITFFLENKPVKIQKTDQRYPKIIQCLSLPKDQVVSAIQETLNPPVRPKAPKGVTEVTPHFQIEGDQVTFRGYALPVALSQKVLSLIEEGVPLDSFEKFWDNLEKNPSNNSVNELYDFLAYKELPITEDGHFLAYKGINDDLYSCHGNASTRVLKGTVNDNHRIFNGVGEEIEVLRRDVDDVRNHDCSYGLHVGSLNYARGFAQKVVVVKVNPRDVVSVPTDCLNQKCRVCRYVVVSDFEEEITQPVVAANGVVIDEITAENKAVCDERTEFMKRIKAYLDRQRNQFNYYVSLRSIQNSFSPKHPTRLEVLEAVNSLGYNWIETKQGPTIVLPSV